MVEWCTGDSKLNRVGSKAMNRIRFPEANRETKGLEI